MSKQSFLLEMMRKVTNALIQNCMNCMTRGAAWLLKCSTEAAKLKLTKHSLPLNKHLDVQTKLWPVSQTCMRQHKLNLPFRYSSLSF